MLISPSLSFLVPFPKVLSQILSQGQVVSVSADAALPQHKTFQVGAVIITACAPSRTTYLYSIDNGDSVKGAVI